MASGGGKPDKGAEELGTAETDTEQGRGGKENFGELFQGVSSTVAAVWGRDVGVDSKNREGVGIVHAWGRATDYGEKAAERVNTIFCPTLSAAVSPLSVARPRA